jgi:hypothetical protein
MTLQLHCFGESGHSYKAALALEISSLDWTPVFIDFFQGPRVAQITQRSTQWAKRQCLLTERSD